MRLRALGAADAFRLLAAAGTGAAGLEGGAASHRPAIGAEWAIRHALLKGAACARNASDVVAAKAEQMRCWDGTMHLVLALL